jgi:hypothetical protein
MHQVLSDNKGVLGGVNNLTRPRGNVNAFQIFILENNVPKI